MITKEQNRIYVDKCRQEANTSAFSLSDIKELLKHFKGSVELHVHGGVFIVNGGDVCNGNKGTVNSGTFADAVTGDVNGVK